MFRWETVVHREMRSELKKGDKIGHMDFRVIDVVGTMRIVFLAVAAGWGAGGLWSGQRGQRSTPGSQWRGHQPASHRGLCLFHVTTHEAWLCHVAAGF